ncbi:MAG: guanylate kinase [Clostridiales bacterium]|nr:guanylate kinase [Clostridiales bacterium]
MKKRGILIVVSGFSGAGKGTVMRALLEKYDNYALSISATTRNPREGEVDGREYFFKTTEEFEKMIAQDELIEYARYEIEIQGALKVKEKFPQTLLLFITPPNASILRERLIGRGTETMDVIESRMQRAAEEAEGMQEYDYLIINDDLDTCVQEMHNIIEGEHNRSFRNGDFMCQIKEELNGNLKGE